ncbi:hypothetical protein KUCAC02_002427 [Chaenocephalus aceratus]|uniref:Uncharacterized protein n=1 Tax=Chaenocephalus aceratus TaxID=36190 RepID=A0ACB9XVS0_CHAAC|nr:hypothetical protein KUCAC02_002427 [Chaenocephalus aceratus]
MYQKPPERSLDFSQYQLAGLLQRNHLNQRLRGVESEMCQLSAGSAPQLFQQDGGPAESQRGVTPPGFRGQFPLHTLLKIEPAPESRPAAAAWAGSVLTGSKRRAVDRPEPLWRPAAEEGPEGWGHASEDSKPSVSKPFVSKPSFGNTSPPSPRTLKAIQGAMDDSSDEDKVDQDRKEGGVSPRTLLAIQQALAEEEGGFARHGTFINSTATKLQFNVPPPAPHVVISSSEEEPDTLPKGKSDLKETQQAKVYM